MIDDARRRITTQWLWRFAQAALRGEVTWVKYLMASATALVADTSLLLTLVHEGVPAALASAMSYAVGVAVHWMISSRAVFAGEAHDRGSGERQRQKAKFVASALVGLSITTMIVGLCTLAGLPPLAAKAVAVLFSFTATYCLVRHVVFHPALAAKVRAVGDEG